MRCIRESWPCDYAECHVRFAVRSGSGRRQKQLSCCCVVLLTCLTGDGVLSVVACVEKFRLPDVLMVSELGSQRAAAVRDEVAGDRWSNSVAGRQLGRSAPLLVM